MNKARRAVSERRSDMNKARRAVSERRSDMNKARRAVCKRPCTMNKVALKTLAAGLCLLLPCQMFAQSLPLPGWYERRLHPETVQVREVRGVTDRIVAGRLSLTLKDFLELVLMNSTDINLARLDVYTAADQVLATRAPFDPALNLGFTTFRSTSPSFSQISGAPTLSSLNQNSSIGFQQLMPTGGSASLGYVDTRSSSNSSFNLFNPSIQGSLSFQFVQPLLQNRGAIQALAPHTIARTQLLITSRQSESRIADIVQAAAIQYWEAIRARDNVKVLRQTVDLAQKSYDHDKQALDLGALAPLDILQSETQLAERRRDQVQSEYTYRAQLDGLRRLIGADLTAQLRAVEIVQEDDPSVPPEKSAVLPYEEALTAAMKVRPEVDVAEKRLSIDELNAKVARNQLLPRVDLSVQVQTAGLGGNQVAVSGPLGVATPGVSGGLGDSLRQIVGFNYPSYGAGIQITLPTRSSSARAQLTDALVNRTRDQYTRRQIEQQIIQDVRQALNSIELAKASVSTAITARDLAKRNVEAEQQKYELGTITAFELLDSQARLSSSESALLTSHVALQEAYISYHRATWSLLDGLGMVLESPKVN